MSGGVGKRIHGEGPVPARVCVIGDHPSRAEAESGRPFAARRGRANEIDRFFDGVRLPARDECYFTTWIREWCGEDGEFEQGDYDRDLPALNAELRMVQPTVIVALGRSVIRYFLGDVDVETTNAIQWKLPKDSPAWGLFDAPETVVICSGYSPAAGFRSPEISSQVAYNFDQISAFLKGEISARELWNDPFPEPEYEDVQDVTTVDAFMRVGGVLSVDTEGWPDNPWSVQISVRPGHAYVLRSGNLASGERLGDCVRAFAEWVNRHPEKYRFIFHSALHDLTMFRVFGIDTRKIRFDDTAIMAYNLQLEPAGLKPLCTRHCGMKMQDFTDVMGTASDDLARDWLEIVLNGEEAKWQSARQAEFDRLTSTPYTDAKGRLKPGRKLRALPKLPKSDLHKSIDRCLRSKTPRKLWGDQVVDRHEDARARYGPIWAASLDHVPLERAVRYAGRDSDGTLRLAPELRSRIRAADLEQTYAADVSTVPIIDRMQYAGIKPDLDHYQRLSAALGLELEALRARTSNALRAEGYDRETADAFNANSSYHVRDLLYGKFGLPELKRTPGGDPSTNDKILEALEKDPRIEKAARGLIIQIREYREIYKLKSTFVDQIPDYVLRYPFDGRIHASFRITRVVSGRLAASDPNILALPKHGKFAGQFQAGIVAEDGHVLGSWDLSQIELRILAHLSQDPVLLDAFRTGKDLHAGLANRIFGGGEAAHKKGTGRLAAKAINFGIPMGMTEIGLCIELKKNGVDVNEDDAKRWLDETMRRYVEVPNYQQYKIAEARKNGFVTDLCGRRRYVGGIRSFDPGTRSEAERFAFSTPIQAGAQQVAKKAMAYAWEHIILPRQYAGQWIEPLAWIHDDMKLEFQDDIVKDVDAEMVYAMTQTFKGLSVPIETSGDIGLDWKHMVETKDLL